MPPPPLPSTVLGIDGCPGGWVVAEVDTRTPVEERTVRWRRLTITSPDLLGSGAVAIDMPMGLPDAGDRACEHEARRLLLGARSSVFFTPSRAVLDVDEHTDACALAHARGERAPSKQLWGIRPRIRHLDALLRADPTAHQRVVECHPEVSFRQLAPGRIASGKRTAPGVGERIAALAGFVNAAHALRHAPSEAGVDDALDALVCAWTAARWRDGTTTVLGDGAVDAYGLPVRIVV